MTPLIALAQADSLTINDDFGPCEAPSRPRLRRT
jgi:hypothetical protein